LSAPETILLDVTRLIWRRWRGTLPTGVDRVCLAYVEHYGDRAQAVIQRKGWFLTLPPRQSRMLYALLLEGGPDFRRRLLSFFAKAALGAPKLRTPRGAFYLNVGHTGLDEPSLSSWIECHRLMAVYLIHDLIPLTHPQFCRPGEDLKHERRMRTVLASAAGVIGNSQATLDDVTVQATKLGLPMPPAVVGWLSGHTLNRPERALPSGKPYFLVLGTIEGRKNHRLLLDVWSRLSDRLGDKAPRLVIVGARGWQAEDVFAKLDALGPLSLLIDERQRCSDEELAGLLAGARALLMPSYAEGYGMPVFEALQFGTPVIAADLPVYREVAGHIPDFLGADDVAGWEDLILAYCDDVPQRSTQLHRMKGFQVPEWKSHFEAVDAWLGTLQAS
jgi:glycosyltransferase involved in cell wall biosynthesis